MKQGRRMISFVHSTLWLFGYISSHIRVEPGLSLECLGINPKRSSIRVPTEDILRAR